MMKFFASITLLLTLALSGCSATVSLESAPDANSPDCAKVIVRLPNQTAAQTKRITNSQSTAAWGDPVTVTLTCGLDPVTVSSLTCVTAGGVDWIIDESQKPIYRFISFGRKPATLITVNSSKVSGASVLEDLGQAVQFTKQTNKCLG
ncbi:MAG: DUF3515 family protein [Micrococcales bacterium]|nr:DUF3515 family protein [Micrococcales bacterium]NBR54947.1 DUF3515 family protein [Micrococcales bacterium]NBT46372.1 DUF3515 family protein [Actinomycetota bacterium]NBY44118.1 DUF3515 family protein [Micrococcales bacterium]NDE88496.1 DUF3515 family protein [Micrococcales bacterium]